MKFLLVYSTLFISIGIHAQQLKVWVVFKDKPQQTFEPTKYFTSKNLERKKLQHQAIFDGYDLAVNESYVNQLSQNCDSVTFTSRWLNATCIYCTPQQLNIIQSFEFVKEIDTISSVAFICETKKELNDLNKGEINLLKGQTARMKSNEFKKNNLSGKGVTVAIIDAGFTGYKKNGLVKNLVNNNQIKHTYDFIRKSNNVDIGSTHGTAVLSCIGGNLDSISIGCAPEANFLLYRTEKAFNEKFSEEEYWMAAMEEADRQGADIINTSLGYSDRRYFRKDMNGKKSLLSHAANIASKKGMLVVCSAGNEGDVDWKTICTPADADSALTVGAINPWTGIQASWSSYGPSSDKRIKPNVCAYGYVMAASGNEGISETLGTSFSSPLVAGYAACARQLLPKLNPHELLHAIQQSADLFPYYDYAHGYGVPDAEKLISQSSDSIPTFDIVVTDDSLKVIIHENNFKPSYLLMRDYYVSKEDTSYLYTEIDGTKYKKSTHFSDSEYSGSSISSIQTNEPGYFYYNVMNDNEAYLTEYSVLNVRIPLIFKIKKTSDTKTFTFHYKGYTQSIQF